MSTPTTTLNPSEILTETGLWKAIFHMHDVSKMNCIPAIVQSYNPASKMATVLPLVKNVINTSDGEKPVDRPTYEVPVFSISQGGFKLSLPLFPGNTGMLFAVDRDWRTAKAKNSTDLFTKEDPETYKENENKGPQAPDMLGLGDFEYGFFLPMGFSGGESDDEGKIILSRILNPDPALPDTPKIRLEIGDEGFFIVFGEDKYSISKDGIKYLGDGGEEINIITDIRYDISTHQIQKKARTCRKYGSFMVDIGEESSWTMVDGGSSISPTTN